MKTTYLFCIAAIALCSCSKLIQTDSPQNQLTTDKVYADSAAVTAALVNVYTVYDKLINPNQNKFISLYSDELSYTGSAQDNIDFGRSAVGPLNTSNLNNWKNTYFAIYSCNDLLEQLNRSSLSTGITKAFSGEAKFLRALSYLNLIGTYGSVPLVTSTDVGLSANASTTDSATVYNQIKADLLDAQSTLATAYRGSGRVRANRYAATALLARVYLIQQNWAAAESAATEVISTGLYTPLPAASGTFLATSKETILTLWTQTGFITDGPNLIPSSGAPAYFYTGSQMSAFETTDLRKTNWIKTTVVGTSTYYSPYKYHNRAANTAAPEYLIVLRAAEQYLIRAEARAHQSKLTGADGAISDLNVIRARAGLPAYSGPADQLFVLSAIYKERQTELFTEWGNRFFDLRRTGRLNSILTALKPATWKPTAAFLPIPQAEINTDPNLLQNPGY